MHLPSEFVERTKKILNSEWNEFVPALESASPVSIRINAGKRVDQSMPLTDNVPWCENGYYLKQRPQFTFDPLFHAGCYYVQEASSMFVGHAIKKHLKDNVKVLDLCAAPGGKSTLIASLLEKDSLLVSNEIIRSRANILSENMMKWGNPNVIVTNNTPATFSKLECFFDIILVDAPCSGEGMFRKDKEVVNEWSLSNVALCRERQQKILTDVWGSLKPGGILIYSTCTYNAEENEKNVEWITESLGADILSVDIESEWNIDPSIDSAFAAYRFFPHKIKGEGFFLSVLKKTGDNREANHNKRKAEKKQKEKIPTELHRLLKDSEKYDYFQQGSYWYAIDRNLYGNYRLLAEHMNVLNAGICLGEYKGKDFIPNQGLALSNRLNEKAFPLCNIDWNTAITYLKRENITLSENIGKGYILLTYRNIPIGFVKNLGNRANNLYPQEWRIRSANLPEQQVDVLV